MTILRLAWFSPFPPARSGVAAYSAEILPLLEREFAIDRVPESAAHDFVWRHRRRPYDLVVYQLGNAPFHDYMWPYLVRYPGLVVLHDARLHHARARQLLSRQRFDDYRHEFWFDHPDTRREVVEYAIEGLGGPIYYFWPMLRVVMHSARSIAVHNARVADGLSAEYGAAGVETIRMGVPTLPQDARGRAAVRRTLGLPDDAIVFAVFGKLTAEKRLGTILQAWTALQARGAGSGGTFLLLVGDRGEYAGLDAELARSRLAHRVCVAGHVADADIGAHLAAADVCLCLRWPTAQESSAAWLRCLAAGRATVISDLAHLADVPALEPRGWRCTPGPAAPVAVRIDLLDEVPALEQALGRLADDESLRRSLGAAGRAWWASHHTLEIMAADYRRVIRQAAARPAPAAASLPPHLTNDYTGLVREIADRFQVADRVSPLLRSGEDGR
jgi:glycosyltransferase involved in cell wall biosynthesis